MKDEASEVCPEFVAIIPAAGVGQRMTKDIPKQYLQVAGKTLLEHSMQPLLQHAKLQQMIVAIAENDKHWQQLAISRHEKITKVYGGKLRQHSVFNALKFLAPHIKADAWVLVHDAARPCLLASELEQLLIAVSGHATGGILAVPVHDTLKYCSGDEQIQTTVSRSRLWQAYTPQMFRFGVLYRALQEAIADNRSITDEASAVEALAVPAACVVQGQRSNIKVTQPQDLLLVEKLLCV